MSNYKSLSELTDDAIAEEQKSVAVGGPAISLAEAVRQNLPVWEAHLFPLLRAQKKSIYECLVPLLIKAGYEDVTVTSLASSICRVRSQKRKKSQNV